MQKVTDRAWRTGQKARPGACSRNISLCYAEHAPGRAISPVRQALFPLKLVQKVCIHFELFSFKMHTVRE